MLAGHSSTDQNICLFFLNSCNCQLNTFFGGANLSYVYVGLTFYKQVIKENNLPSLIIIIIIVNL